MLQVAFHSNYELTLPVGHRFPMEKYGLLPQQLLYEGTLTAENFFEPTPLAEASILAIHQADYWQKLKTLSLSPAEVRRSGFPLSQALVDREITIAGGTIACAHFAFEHGVSLNIAGGTHHAFPDRGEGFCLLNDQAIAARYLLDNDLAQRIAIIDLDVHQGDGTACIFGHEPRVFTFSMHGEKNYPLRKETSDWDIPLPDQIEDEAYLSILAQALPQIWERAKPDFVFYQAGVDVLASDKLGRLALSLEGCKTRDRLVLETCHSTQTPLMISMGGGYSPRIADIVEAHANTFRFAQAIFG
ncbi:MAG TPA: histone deacetylase [Microscillaceae bacterium]|jgi:acetoin utilization deacetylase AcuC-like enzyme|nr:histone deacetylase [Microscillaceae bacterium]